MADVANKFPKNVSGRFYVDDQCIDCDLCQKRPAEPTQRLAMRKSHNRNLQPILVGGARLTKVETKISQSMKALNLQLKTERPVLDLDAAIRERHSTRMFLPQQPVPRTLVDEALALAQLAPSNSNIQRWRMALTERGLGSCVEVSVAGYPEVIRTQLAIPAELSIICGLAVGYPDPDLPGNKLHVGREPIAKDVVFLDS